MKHTSASHKKETRKHGGSGVTKIEMEEDKRAHPNIWITRADT